MHAVLKFICLPALLLTGVAGAHGGFENETEVRVESDRMRVVIRTSRPFAWKILGDKAPRTADEAGQALAKPLLTAAAPGLFQVTAAGKPRSPTKADSLFEIDDHVAFVLQFERPAEWPVTVEAKFFPLFGELDSGTIAVFDQTTSRFSRDIEPLMRKTIDANDPAVSFDLGARKIANQPPQASPPPVPAAEPPVRQRNFWLIPLLLVIAGIAGWLARAAWRRTRAAS